MKKKPAATKQPPSTPRICALKPSAPRAFGANVSPPRQRAIIATDKKWVNGTHLTYWFFSGPDSQKKAMRKAFKVWEDVGIGISFGEVSDRDDALIRIAFQADGSWSYLGREILTIDKSQPTLNIGWDISTDLDTGVHEIGHTLAMPHEHQNPNAGIVWDEAKVYEELAKPPNHWPHDTTYWNIIRKIPADEVIGTDWDPDSIMHYPFGKGLIIKPEQYAEGLTPAGGLSAKDKALIKSIYPKVSGAPALLKPFVAEPIIANSGDSVVYSFKPSETRKYKVRMFGDTDAVMVLTTGDKEAQKTIAGTDDSGEDQNGELECKLERGTTYQIRIRLMFRRPGSESALMVW